MTEKELRRLSRRELLHLLLEKNRQPEMPENTQIALELARENERVRFRSILRSTLCTLVVVAALAVLAATIWFPVLQIYGSSMTPTLEEGDIVVSVKGNEFESGDLIAFYVGNKILVKRCIGGPGQWVEIDEDGNVSVDGILLEEPYLTEKSLGDCNISMPYQVPENRYFCMGDHRATSVDSRHTNVGCVSEEQVVGKILFRVWPICSFGALK